VCRESVCVCLEKVLAERECVCLERVLAERECVCVCGERESVCVCLCVREKNSLDMKIERREKETLIYLMIGASTFVRNKIYP
jgi:hypothetical protein